MNIIQTPLRIRLQMMLPLSPEDEAALEQQRKEAMTERD